MCETTHYSVSQTFYQKKKNYKHVQSQTVCSNIFSMRLLNLFSLTKATKQVSKRNVILKRLDSNWINLRVSSEPIPLEIIGRPRFVQKFRYSLAQKFNSIRTNKWLRISINYWQHVLTYLLILFFIKYRLAIAKTFLFEE